MAEPVMAEPIVAEPAAPAAPEPALPIIGERPTVSAPAEPATLFAVAQAAMAIVEPEEPEAVAVESPAAAPSTIVAAPEPGPAPAWEVEVPALEEGETEPVAWGELFAAPSDTAPSDTASPIATARAAHLAHDTAVVFGSEAIGTAPIEYTSELVDFGFDEEPDWSELALEPAAPPLLVLSSPAASPVEEQPGPRRKPPAPPPQRWRVPGWVTVPVLSVAIPHSLFAFGKPDGRIVSIVPAAEPPPPDGESLTVGFAEPEALVVTAPPSPPPAKPEPGESEPGIAEPAGPFAEPAPEPRWEPEAIAPAKDEYALVDFAETAADEAPLVELLSPLNGAAPPAPAARHDDAILEAHLRMPQRPLGAPQAAREHPEPANPASADPVEPDANVDDYLPADAQSVRNRRLYRRVGLTSEVHIAGEPAELLDLSVDGFAILGGPAVAPNTPVPITLQLGLDDDEVSTQLLARILYTDGDRSAGRFVELNAKQSAFLRYIVTSRAAAAATLAPPVEPLPPPASPSPLSPPSPSPTASPPPAVAQDEAPPAPFPAYSYPSEHSAPVMSQQDLPWWRRLFRRFRNRPAASDQ